MVPTSRHGFADDIMLWRGWVAPGYKAPSGIEAGGCPITIETTEATTGGRVAGDTLALAVVMLLIGIFGICQGLTYPLLSLILERQGVDSALIGLSSAATPVGIVVFAMLMPVATRRLGSPGIALCCTFGLVALLGAMGARQDVWFWFPLRVLLGFAVCGLFVTTEMWINVIGPAPWRGRLLGLYSSALALGFAAGPFVLIGTGSVGWPPFLAGMAIMAAAAVLLLVVFRRLPDAAQDKGVSLRTFLPLAPGLLATVGLVAAFDQALLSLLPVYGSAKGLGEREIAVAITVWAAGNILFQLPIGWLADRWSRRGTLALLCAVTVAGAAALPFCVRSPGLLWPLLFLWGPASYGAYTLCIVELGTRFRGTMLLAGNSAFAVMWGIGGMAGPPTLGLAMDHIGLEGLPISLGLIYVAVLGILAIRRSA